MSWRIPVIDYSVTNRYFTWVCFGFPPILGSLTSTVWNGGAIWCCFEILSGRRRLTSDRPALVLSLFMYAYVAASLLSAFVSGMEQAELYRLLPLATFLMFPFSYSIWSISDKTVIARAALFASLVASYGALVLAIIQFHVLGIRAEGGSGNALIFAMVTCMAGAVCLAGSFSLGSRVSAPLIGAFAASIAALIYSQSRLIWAAAAVTTLLLLWLFRARVRRMLSVRTVVPAVALLLVIGTLGFDLVWSRTELLFHNWNALTEDQNYETSVGLRIALWQVGLDLFRESPFIGHGMHATKGLITRGFREDYGLDIHFSHFHNGFLTLLVETGVLGASAVAAIFVSAAVIVWRTLRLSSGEVERFGAAMLAVTISVYTITGSANLMIGHDIVDAVLMTFLVVGTYLAAGSSMSPRPAGSAQGTDGEAAN